MTKIVRLKPAQEQVIDPHDGKPRPFCNTIGKLVAVAFNQHRYLAPTPEEDAIWRRDGQAYIDRVQGKAQGPATRHFSR